MNALDEMRMQCFMWGNNGFTPFTTLVTFTFLFWTPEMWSDAKYHFRAGKLVKDVSKYRLESSIYLDLENLCDEIELYKAKQYLDTIRK